jgi:hypothetical protein
MDECCGPKVEETLGPKFFLCHLFFVLLIDLSKVFVHRETLSGLSIKRGSSGDLLEFYLVNDIGYLRRKGYDTRCKSRNYKFWKVSWIHTQIIVLLFVCCFVVTLLNIQWLQLVFVWFWAHFFVYVSLNICCEQFQYIFCCHLWY